jgi:hypothetical protein
MNGVTRRTMLSGASALAAASVIGQRAQAGEFN